MMKPNDKAYAAARSAILKAIAERNCIIAGVPFNENNTDEFDAGEAVEHAKVALDAAYAAQFPPSEDYAELLRKARIKATMLLMCEPIEFGSDSAIINNLSDALEALLAERDALKAELAAANTRMSKLDFERTAAELERDALLARLAPADDEALVEIAAKAISKQIPCLEVQWGDIRDAAIDALAAIRPHIEAAERERCAKVAESHSYPMKTVAGTGYNNAAKEIAAAIRSGK